MTKETRDLSAPKAEPIIRDQLVEACAVAQRAAHYHSTAKPRGGHPGKGTGRRSIRHHTHCIHRRPARGPECVVCGLRRRSLEILFVMRSHTAVQLPLRGAASGSSAFVDVGARGGTLLGIPVVIVSKLVDGACHRRPAMSSCPMPAKLCWGWATSGSLERPARGAAALTHDRTLCNFILLIPAAHRLEGDAKGDY